MGKWQVFNEFTDAKLPILYIYIYIYIYILKGLINIWKAVDEIDHEIKSCYKSLKQLDSQRKLCSSGFRSYLSDRIFLVNIKSKPSDFGKIYCGVSQGSILGPLLLLIYVNNIPQAVKLTLLYIQMIHTPLLTQRSR